MTAHELRQEIDQLVALLSEIELLVKSNSTTIAPSQGFTWVSWARPAESGLPLGGETVAEYRAILRNGEYTCILRDGAVIQITYALKGNRLLKHRFCWIPAPVVVDPKDVKETDLAELIDQGLLEAGLHVLDDDEAGDDLLLVAPVRFDYDPDAHEEDHAACHLTFNRSSCRVPVFGPLSLGHFVRFVFRHFYPDEWAAEQRLRAWALRFGSRMITPAQEEEIFVECRHGQGLLARFTRGALGR
jgi:hypothetical protein